MGEKFNEPPGTTSAPPGGPPAPAPGPSGPGADGSAPAGGGTAPPGGGTAPPGGGEGPATGGPAPGAGGATGAKAPPAGGEGKPWVYPLDDGSEMVGYGDEWVLHDPDGITATWDPATKQWLDPMFGRPMPDGWSRGHTPPGVQ